MSTTSILTPTQRYAAVSLFALSLQQAQMHQTRPLTIFRDEDEDEDEERSSSGSEDDLPSEDPDSWVHESSDLLRPVFRFMDIDQAAWHGIEKTAVSSPSISHVEGLLRSLSKHGSVNSKEEVELARAIDGLADTMVPDFETLNSKKEHIREYENQCRVKLSKIEATKHLAGDAELPVTQDPNLVNLQSSSSSIPPGLGRGHEFEVEPIEGINIVSHQRKITVLYELLSACLANIGGDDKNCSRRNKGYDARHRVSLRLLATWFDIKWIKMEAMETIVACSAMAVAKEREAKEEQGQSPKGSWNKWRRGGIIGAAALTGGALMAITGGLAAPAIAAGLSALAPTLTIIPVIGTGIAAFASAAGTVAGSVAVAASFGAAGAGLTGSKMARRIGAVDEFEFKVIGDNQNQGRLAVKILISGFVFDEKDFIKPWEGQNDNLEKYALQWESKNLIALSTALQDLVTSWVSLGFMKQEAIMTVLGGLASAFAWPTTLVAAADLVDSKYTIALNRSDKAGQLLADVLKKGLHGNRPVTLIGFSLGARVIFKCLQILAETEQHAEYVERVVLVGAPIPVKHENWRGARKMVSGRFINVYSTNDWTLGLAFRASVLTHGLAGIQPADFPGIENVDVTNLIEGHSSYLWETEEILERLQLDTYYPTFSSMYSLTG